MTRPHLGREVQEVQAGLQEGEQGVQEVTKRLQAVRGEEERGEVHSWCVGEEEQDQERLGERDTPFVKKNRRARLNVGGVKHEVMWGMLVQVGRQEARKQHIHSWCQVPDSRLGRLALAETVGEVLKLLLT